MTERINPRDVERSQGELRPHGDGGESLRQHIEERRLPRDIQQAQRVEPTPVRTNDPYVPEPDPSTPALLFPAEAVHSIPASKIQPLIKRIVLYQVFDATGRFVQAFPPEQAAHARGYARNIRGFMLPAEAEDYRA